jgi:hypothetical protein
VSLIGIAEQLEYCNKETYEIQISTRDGKTFETIAEGDSLWNLRKTFYKTEITSKGKKRFISKRNKQIRILQEVNGKQRKEK